LPSSLPLVTTTALLLVLSTALFLIIGYMFSTNFPSSIFPKEVMKGNDSTSWKGLICWIVTRYSRPIWNSSPTVEEEEEASEPLVVVLVLMVPGEMTVVLVEDG
jgi:hypothetical protein